MWVAARRTALTASRLFRPLQYLYSSAASMVTMCESESDSDGFHTFTVAGSRYMVSSETDNSIMSLQQKFGLATVFTLPAEEKPNVTAKWMKESVDHYSNNDDVFNEAFLATVILHGAEDDAVNINDEARQYLDTLGTKQVVCSKLPGLLPGPYVLVRQQLRDVWKLVDDTYGTCMVTLMPQSRPSHGFQPLSVMSSDHRFSSFALQSKVKTKAASQSPIAGMRIVVKDNIDLKGVHTSVGVRALYETYPPREESAGCVQRLIDLGVAVVGKAKMSSLATWEEPIQSIDYQAPWNPRADKHQSPGGSSSGSAAAAAAYDWLDIAIGTDTWGSVTRPASWCGCYGLRPSFGAVSATGIFPCCATWDTAGILGKDLQQCRDFGAEWLLPEALQRNPKPFSSIIWAKDCWEVIDSHQVDIAREFTKQIQSTLKAEYREVSFKDEWNKSPPTEAKGSSLSDYIDDAADVQDWDAYHNCDDFIEAYEKLTGHAPYVSPPNQSAWAYAQRVSREERDEGFKRIAIYKRWVEDRFINTTHENTLIIMPQESMQPRYRDDSSKFQKPPPGVNCLALAAVLEAPVLAVPIAEIPFHSRITQREEKLPLSVAVVGNPGTDLALMDTLLDVLKKARLPTRVKTGRVMFD